MGGKFLHSERPEYTDKKDEFPHLGPGSYATEHRVKLSEDKVRFMKEFYKEIGSIPNQRQKEAKERREALEAAKLEVLRMQMGDEVSYGAEQDQHKIRPHKQPFNSTAPRSQEIRREGYQTEVGPGRYNPINKTIMEGYIHQKLAAEKVKVVMHRLTQKPEFEYRVFNRTTGPQRDQNDYRSYELPGAFDNTLKKAKRADFIGKQVKYPSSFGSSVKRF